MQFLQGTFPLLSLLLSMSKFPPPVCFPKLLHQELQKTRWRAETGSDYCQGKQWFKAILSFVETTIYFVFVAPRKRGASFCLHHRICLVLSGTYASVAHRDCTQPGGHRGAFCLLSAPTVTCRVLWGSRTACGSWSKHSEATNVCLVLSKTTLELCFQPLRSQVGNSLCSTGKLIRLQLGKQRIWVGYPLCGLLEVPHW